MRLRVVGAVVAGLLSFLAYCGTLAPGLTWAHDGADGGDLAAAVAAGGVPHPPGYPTYLRLGRLFAFLPLRDVAFRLNLMSAVCAAIAVGLVFLVIVGLCGDDSLPAIGAAAAAVLMFAFSPVFWSQAVITEVYALNALFVALLLLLALCPQTSPVLILFVLGLGLGNHLSLILLVPTVLIVRWPAPTSRPASRGAFFKRLLFCALALAAGLAVYLILPLRAASDPAVNWGDARTLDRFAWLVSGGPYRPYVFGLPLADLAGRLSAWAALLVQQFGWVGIALALFGLWDMLATGRSRKDVRVARALLLAVGLYSLYAVGYHTADSYVYLIPVYLVVALWLGRGLYAAATACVSWITGRTSESSGRRRFVFVWLGVVILLLPLTQYHTNLAAADVSNDHSARDYVEQALAELPAGAIVLTGSDEHTFALWYGQASQGRNDLLVTDRDLTQFRWYRDELRQRAPQLAAAPDSGDPGQYVPALIAAARQQRDVFLADADPGLQSSFQWQEMGVLSKRVGPGGP